LVEGGTDSYLSVMNQPEIALLISTYQRPAHLRRALESVALQQGVDGQMEVVVTDDGSTDETANIVSEFAARVPFRVGFTTHEHGGFQLARCRNEGARSSSAPYLLFLDGDCVLPRDHVRKHLDHRRPNTVMAGDCARLDEEPSARVTLEVIQRGEFTAWAPDSELKRLRKADRSARFYRLIRHPTKPKLIGNNVGIWRRDYERVNGYDENYHGWGCEDDDLRHRLRKAGVQIASILRWTHTYHLWHPNVASMPAHWKDGANVRYLLRPGRLTQCRNGLHKRSVDELAIRIVARTTESHPVADWLRGRFGIGTSVERPEVEILVGEGRFSGRADCNVLIAIDPAHTSAVKGAHLVLHPQTGDEVERALAGVA
jgi:glycosyltransferase involved in cell wall biosynthesis